MHEKMVSIIIPMYNVEKYLNECLQSVINQTFRNLEIICIDDASTDKTLMIANSIAKSDSRICILKNECNKGLSYTRNRGMDIAKGKYIYFLDSDDMVTENAIQELWSEAENKQLDVIFFDGYVIFEDKGLADRFRDYRTHHLGEYNPIMDGLEAFNAMIKNGEWSVNVPREFWKRNFLREHNIRFENGMVHEDELFSTLAIMQVQRCSVMKNQYFIRRFRENSIMTSKKSQANMNGYFKCMSKVIEYLSWHEYDIENNAALNIYLNKIKSAIINYLSEHNDWTIEVQSPLEYAVKKMIELEIHGLFLQEDVKKMHIADAVYIYGAGKVANQVFGELIRLSIYPIAFIVTNKKNNNNTLWGLPVEEITECSSIFNSVVIIAIKDKEQVNVVRELLSHYSFRDVIMPQF